MRSRKQGFWLALIYVMIGALVGTLLGHFLSSLWAPLAHNYFVIGSGPGTSWSLNLGVVGLSIGGWLDLNLGGIIGLIVGLIWYQRRG